MERKRNASGLIGAFKMVVRDVGQGLLVVSHNTLALVGLLVLSGVLIGMSRDDTRMSIEKWAFGWLQERHEARNDIEDSNVQTTMELSTAAPVLVADSTAAERATAANPQSLTDPQAAVTHWIARRYKVAPEPVSRLVQEAWEVGKRAKLEPTLILAIIAVESSFNPFAQSNVGAQGLMQVMTRVHDKKFEPFGGNWAAFDPVSNLHVGVQVLRECIARAGNLYDGLRHYVGAANLPSDGGYAGKVLGEHAHLMKVAQGKTVPHTAPIVPVPAPATAKGNANDSPQTSISNETRPDAAVSAPESASPAETPADPDRLAGYGGGVLVAQAAR